MKKRIKSILCLALMLALSLCCTVPSLATSASAQSPLDKGSATAWEAVPLEEAQAVDLLALRLPLFREETVAVYNKITSEGGSVVEARTHYQVGCGYAVTVNCLAAILPQEGGGWRIEVLDLWTLASGSGSYTWTEFYVYADIPEPNPQTIRLMARGTLTVEAAADNPADWEAAGFAGPVPQEDTIYYSKTFSIDQDVTTVMP